MAEERRHSGAVDAPLWTKLKSPDRGSYPSPPPIRTVGFGCVEIADSTNVQVDDNDLAIIQVEHDGTKDGE